jgi:UDP-N-acetylmuramoylalanine--D-glutamate ligase
MDLSGKKVAVYGLGVTGLAVLEALQAFNLAQLVIVNGNLPSESDLKGLCFKTLPKYLAEADATCESCLGEMDIILLSPGVPKTKDTLKAAHKNGVKIWNEIEWCSQEFGGEIIGVTGTNGKTTTVTFLDQAFKNAGVRVFTGGNIGIPFSSVYHDRGSFDLVLLEMSSFQCESLETFRPSVAAFLNLFANHGERYSSVEEYRLSKWEIVRNQRQEDIILTGPGSGNAPEFVDSHVQEIPESWPEELNSFIDWKKVCLVGEHNRQNIWFAWKIFCSYFELKKQEIPIESFKESLYSFRGVEHRVESCPPYNDHLVFNDAKSTNWQATLSALSAVKEVGRPVILIIGGKLRGLNDDPSDKDRSFIDSCASHILGLGEAANALEESWPKLENVLDLDGMKSWLDSYSGQNACVLFSPGFPSFDQFRDYADRGRQFKDKFST